MSRLHRRVMRLLIVDVVGGVLAEGEALPREADLAAHFDVSRGVVREALRGLEERGLVTVKHGRGTTVAKSRGWNVLDPDVLSVLLQTGARSGVLHEYLEARRILEIEAAGLAAERAGPDDLVALSQALAETKTAAERAAVNRAAEHLFLEADLKFHNAIMEAAGNRVLSRLTEPIRFALLQTRAPASLSAERFNRGMAEHTRILSAIAGGDSAGAREAMEMHLATVELMHRDYLARVEKDTVEQGSIEQ